MFFFRAIIQGLGSYDGFNTMEFECFDIEWTYYDTVSCQDVPTTLTEIIRNPASPAHYQRRSLILFGKTRDGKTYLARAMCRMLAIMEQKHVSIDKRKFLEISNHEQMKNSLIKEHLNPGVPVLFDDLNPGKTMHPNADPEEFLKAMFGVDQSKMLHCRNFNATLAVGPRIFTSNSPDVAELLRLKDGSRLPTAHFDAVNARIVKGCVQSRMFSEEQSTSVAVDRTEDFTEQANALNELISSGII
jgi:hypothetical protein